MYYFAIDIDITAFVKKDLEHHDIAISSSSNISSSMSKTVAMSESESRNITESSSKHKLLRGEPSSFTGNLPKDQDQLQHQDRIPDPTPKSR